MEYIKKENNGCLWLLTSARKDGLLVEFFSVSARRETCLYSCSNCAHFVLLQRHDAIERSATHSLRCIIAVVHV
jgi:hypothetical protein